MTKKRTKPVVYKRIRKLKKTAEPVISTPQPGPQADINFEDELWEAAVKLRGNIAPADYKHYVLPILFLRYLSIRYEKRREQLQSLIREPKSEYFTEDPGIAKEILNDPDEYRKKGVYIVPKKARWEYLVEHAQDDDIKIKLDQAMESLEKTYSDLRGVLPKIYAGSNLSRENVTGLINLFAKDTFRDHHGNGSDILGRVYEYFITNFASTEGTRGGEFFTPRSIVKLLVAMMEPKEGRVFDPACGSGGMFVQSDIFAKHSGTLAFFGQESVDTTLRLGKMNLILHGLNGDIRLGNSLLADKFPDLKADFVIANPPFNLKEWGADKVAKEDKRLVIGKVRCAPTNSNANYFWMMHFLYHLKDGGTAAFVMANGAMTTSVTEEREARNALIEGGFVDCVVQLPEKLFFGTGIPACLWFFSKNRDGRGAYRRRIDEILFIDARNKGEMVSRRQRVLTDKEIGEFAGLYRHYREVEGKRQEIPGFCKTETIEIVKKHDYKLTPGVYVGSGATDKDDTPFEEKMESFTSELQSQFAKANELQERIIRNLKDLPK